MDVLPCKCWFPVNAGKKSCVKGGHWIPYQCLQEADVYRQYIHWNSFGPKARKIILTKP